MIRPLHHDILGTGAGSHPGYFGPDALPHNRIPEGALRDSTCVHFDDFIAVCAAHRGFALHHVLTAHEDFGAVSVLMTIQQFSRNNAAEFFDLVYVTINCLLQDFIDHFKVTGKIRSFQASWQVNVNIKI